eukprot:1729401-Amphidinium_carterae.1
MSPVKHDHNCKSREVEVKGQHKTSTSLRLLEWQWLGFSKLVVFNLSSGVERSFMVAHDVRPFGKQNYMSERYRKNPCNCLHVELHKVRKLSKDFISTDICSMR